MTTFTIELDDNLVEVLQDEARNHQTSLQEWIALKLRQNTGSETTSNTRYETVSDEEFEAIARYALEKNAELYRRLV